MRPPRPGSHPRAFAQEYQRQTAAAVQVTWRDEARQWIAAGPGSYVEFLEIQLKEARRKLAETTNGRNHGNPDL